MPCLLGVVAIIAGKLLVMALQRKASVCVVKHFANQAGYIRIAAFMIRMAGFAGILAGRRSQSVVSRTIGTIRSDVVVAIQTALGHGFFCKGYMAIVAVRFKLGMCLSQWAGHQNLLFD